MMVASTASAARSAGARLATYLAITTMHPGVWTAGAVGPAPLSFTVNVRFVEAQVEYAGLDHLGPWVSLMTGASNGCEVVGVNEVDGNGGGACGDFDRWGVMSGWRLGTGPGHSLEAFVSAGLGLIREPRFRGGVSERGAATLTAGLFWAASTWFRNRIEYGYMTRALGENGLALGFGMVF